MGSSADQLSTGRIAVEAQVKLYGKVIMDELRAVHLGETVGIAGFDVLAVETQDAVIIFFHDLQGGVGFGQILIGEVAVIIVLLSFL